MRTGSGIGNVTSGAALQRPEVQFRPDPARAASLGVTAEAAADAIRIGTYGDYSTSLPKLNLPERQIALRARIDPALRARPRCHRPVARGRHPWQRDRGVGRPLSIGSGPSQIDRLDRERNVTLSVELNGRTLGEVNREAQQLSALAHLPAGVHQVEQGELQNMGELFQSFGLAMAIGVFCVYAVLVLLFHDFLQLATILCALPLSLGGALFSLLITRMSFSMPALIGLLMLMGIVTKNSILLVEYAIMARREHGMCRLEALMDACHKRARPILMTTIAMGAGMLPNALGLGAAELPPAHGDRRDRWPARLHAAEPARDSGGVHLCGRFRAVATPPFQAHRSSGSHRLAAGTGFRRPLVPQHRGYDSLGRL